MFTGANSAETVARYERAGYVQVGQGEDDRGVRLATSGGEVAVVQWDDPFEFGGDPTPADATSETRVAQ